MTDLECPLCVPCTESLWPITAACPRCALPIEGPLAVVCRRCRLKPPPIQASVATFRYGGELAVALRRLKYANRPDLARQLAPLFTKALVSVAQECNTLIPVPLHWKRESARGYNQARILLSRGLNRHQRKKIDALSLRRHRHTIPQSGLRARHREANVKGAFVVTKRRLGQVAGNRILLFDDIITTGTTIAAAATALHRAGATEVVAFSIARAPI